MGKTVCLSQVSSKPTVVKLAPQEQPKTFDIVFNVPPKIKIYDDEHHEHIYDVIELLDGLFGFINNNRKKGVKNGHNTKKHNF